MACTTHTAELISFTTEKNVLSWQNQQLLLAKEKSLRSLDNDVIRAKDFALERKWTLASDVIADSLQRVAEYADFCEVNIDARNNERILKLVNYLREISELSNSVMDHRRHEVALYVLTKFLRMLSACDQKHLLALYLYVIRNTSYMSAYLDTSRLAFTTISEKLLKAEVFQLFPDAKRRVLSSVLFDLGITPEAASVTSSDAPLSLKILQLGLDMSEKEPRQQARYTAAMGFMYLASDVKKAIEMLLRALCLWQKHGLTLDHVEEFKDTVNNALMAVIHVQEMSHERTLRALLLWLCSFMGRQSDDFNLRLANGCLVQRAAQLSSHHLYPQAMLYYEFAYRLMRNGDDDNINLYNVAFNLQAVAFDMKDYERCLTYLKQCENLLDELKVSPLKLRSHRAMCDVMIGLVHRYLGNETDAREYLARAHARRMDLSASYLSFLRAADLGSLQYKIGLKYELQGDLVEANKQFNIAEIAYEEDMKLGDPQAQQVLFFCCLLERRGKYRKALQLLKPFAESADSEYRSFAKDERKMLPSELHLPTHDNVNVPNSMLANLVRLRAFRKLHEHDGVIDTFKHLNLVSAALSDIPHLKVACDVIIANVEKFL